MILVAKLYYLGNMSQNDIAGMLGISRPKVSRMLSLARQRNIVEFVIDASGAQRERMREAIRNRYGLRSVLIAPSAPTPEQTLDNLALLSAAFLAGELRDGMRIGISFSTVVDTVIRRFTPAAPMERATVYQMLGGTLPETGFTDARDSVIMLAEKLHATPKIIHAPLVVGNTLLKELLLQEPEMASHFEALAHLDMALIGLGSAQADQCLLYKSGYITLEESAGLLRSGLAADICAHRMNELGQEQQTFLTGRIIGIDPAILKKTPTVMGIGAGAAKLQSILAAIHGGYIHVLAIDELAAIALMAHDGAI